MYGELKTRLGDPGVDEQKASSAGTIDCEN